MAKDPESSDRSLALLTDLYQLTMCYGYWKLGRADHETAFHLFFRKLPFHGGYAIAAGIEQVAAYVEQFRFDESDLAYLKTLCGNDSKPLFSNEFIQFLGELKLTCDIVAIPEGNLVFENEPLVRVQGPILQCQLLETALLNLINFPTLIATKAARICQAAKGEPVLEFGLRRAQGMDGALTASRAAYIGGCAATSNLLAGKRFGIPVKGTHAHSWVMSFDDELESFEAYAAAMPNNCVFLVDTYDTLEGVKKAIEVGKKLKADGHQMVGVRLDSGDLAYLSIEARKLLDQAGFENAAIVASNDLDENVIESLKSQGAKIAVWGVGTRLVTAYDQPALGGVYKLGAMREPNGNWTPKLKVSENSIKTSIPGILQVRRFSDKSGMLADMIYDESLGVQDPPAIVDPAERHRKRPLRDATSSVELLRPLIRNGKTVSEPEGLDAIRNRVQSELANLHTGTKRLLNPHRYPVGLETQLNRRRNELIENALEHETDDQS